MALKKNFIPLFLIKKDKMLPEKFLVKNLSLAFKHCFLKYSQYFYMKFDFS